MAGGMVFGACVGNERRPVSVYADSDPGHYPDVSHYAGAVGAAARAGRGWSAGAAMGPGDVGRRGHGIIAERPDCGCVPRARVAALPGIEPSIIRAEGLGTIAAGSRDVVAFGDCRTLARTSNASEPSVSGLHLA